MYAEGELISERALTCEFNISGEKPPLSCSVNSDPASAQEKLKKGFFWGGGGARAGRRRATPSLVTSSSVDCSVFPQAVPGALRPGGSDAVETEWKLDMRNFTEMSPATGRHPSSPDDGTCDVRDAGSPAGAATAVNLAS
ncbi:hypothetical protein AUCHE_03_00600 [Austwickia chelonae NBRC 105200]|uniref:Uncharacterized protein n=1 Tax=Austwickia chelonae NBRC 105200 TaxID=1184607 RepID=K6V3Y5_9MICO|nr:hypothetical protein AUCHE_03_00600 [Austwickia chelonae NBRC 105200]